MIDILDVIKNSESNPFLLGLLFGNLKFNAEKNKFYIYSSYRHQNAILDREIKDTDIKETHDTLIQKTGLIWYNKQEQSQFDTNNKVCKSFNHVSIFSNDTAVSFIHIYNKLLALVVNISKENRQDFISGFFACRASLDQNRKTVTIDYWYETAYELETKTRALLSLFSLGELHAIMPINFRDLQPDYVHNDHKRETQFRLKANWFTKNAYLINPYKNECLKIVKDSMQDFKQANTKHDFLKRLSQYSEYIYGKETMQDAMEEYRNKLGFSKDKVYEHTRDQNLISIVRELLPDECAGCSEKYDINDRTFPHKNRGGVPYLEIHHIISLANNQDLDTEFNLSKLCPVCHTSMKKGRAEQSYQKQIINRILDHHSVKDDFIQKYLNTDNRESTVNKICEMLR